MNVLSIKHFHFFRLLRTREWGFQSLANKMRYRLYIEGKFWYDSLYLKFIQWYTVSAIMNKWKLCLKPIFLLILAYLLSYYCNTKYTKFENLNRKENRQIVNHFESLYFSSSIWAIVKCIVYVHLKCFYLFWMWLMQRVNGPH